MKKEPIYLPCCPKCRKELRIQYMDAGAKKWICTCGWKGEWKR